MTGKLIHPRLGLCNHHDSGTAASQPQNVLFDCLFLHYIIVVLISSMSACRPYIYSDGGMSSKISSGAVWPSYQRVGVGQGSVSLHLFGLSCPVGFERNNMIVVKALFIVFMEGKNYLTLIYPINSSHHLSVSHIVVPFCNTPWQSVFLQVFISLSLIAL
jgi:hypothetical protein